MWILLAVIGWFVVVWAITAWSLKSNSILASVWLIIIFIAFAGAISGIIAGEVEAQIASNHVFQLFTWICIALAFPALIASPILESYLPKNGCPFSGG